MDIQRQLKLPFGAPITRGTEVKPKDPLGRPSVSSAPEDQKIREKRYQNVMGIALAPESRRRALAKIESKKKAAPGIDGMTALELRPYLEVEWPMIKQSLLTGTYIPKPLRRVEIPKESGGTRTLGIPITCDKFVQNMLLKGLTYVFEPLFSENSYGFRPGRSQQQAIEQTLVYVQEKRWVVDIDISKCFDRVNHDILMALLAAQIEDKEILKTIRGFLESGIMVNGVVIETREGTPQGGPLSPILSNVILNELDKELERRGHSFVRYADDVQIYVGSKRAGERVMESICRFLEEKLRLKVNHDKSSVDRITNTSYLGFSFYLDKRENKICLTISEKTRKKFKKRIKDISNRRRSPKRIIEEINKYLNGWLAYFFKANIKSWLSKMMGWLRRRLRMCVWKQWKHVRTRIRKLRGLGLSNKEALKIAFSRKGYWALSKTHQLHKALGNKYWSSRGLMDAVSRYLELR